MLQTLRITHFALAENLEIQFDPGFIVLTGETGAGKSILIDALSLSLGMPAHQDMIRGGQKKAFVEAHFFISGTSVLRKFLHEQQLDADNNTLVLSREFHKEKGSACRLNGQTVSLSLLKKTAQHLVDIHGQHEHQTLFQTESHIEYLDAYAGKKALNFRECIAREYDALRRHEHELEELLAKERERVRRLDIANYELEEIKAAHCEPGEDKDLEQRIHLHQNQEKLVQHTKEAYKFIADEALTSLFNGSREIQVVSEIDKRFTAVKEFLDGALALLSEAVSFLRDYQSNLDFDTQSFENDMERDEILKNLKRKYGSVDDVLKYADTLQVEITSLQHLDERKNELEKKVVDMKNKLLEEAKQLSDLREKTALKLESAVQKELSGLGIPEAKFKIKITQTQGGGFFMTAKGIDSVEFLFSANPGEDVKPLTRIASGGEISRVMLALKTALAKQDPVPVLVFDEIDAGIGGETAMKVARKLSHLARSHQVICITHLATIASYADTHILVQKNVKSGKTVISTDVLIQQQRVQEIARMLRGEGKSATTLKDAQELLESAAREKKK